MITAAPVHYTTTQLVQWYSWLNPVSVLNLPVVYSTYSPVTSRMCYRSWPTYNKTLFVAVPTLSQFNTKRVHNTNTQYFDFISERKKISLTWDVHISEEINFFINHYNEHSQNEGSFFVVLSF
jgi:hypothetical protein